MIGKSKGWDVLALTLVLNAGAALAAQQQWASQYVSWSFGRTPPADVINIDQQVWIPRPADSSFWPLQWSWNGSSGVGGYLGLQQERGTSHQQVRFSLWDATAAEGAHCRTFGGEGVGYTCTLPVTIDPGKLYRLRLWRTRSESAGQWWGAWLIEQSERGELTEHAIGQILVASEYRTIDPGSISNFVEYFGAAVRQCDDVPQSAAGFGPPSVNYHGQGTGRYEATATYAGSRRAELNPCVSGREERGAHVTVERYDFGFGIGVLVYLGGREVDPVRRPGPTGLPGS